MLLVAAGSDEAELFVEGAADGEVLDGEADGKGSEFHEVLPEGADLKPLRDRANLDEVLFQLHLFIHSRLRQTAEGAKSEVGGDPAGGKLRDYLGAFLDGIDEDEAWERAGLFHEELCNAHAVAVFVELLKTHMNM